MTTPKLKPTGPALARTIKGESYAVRPVEGGWQAIPAGSPINRITRNYLIKCTAAGQPISCECPHHQHRGVVCKHMQEVAKILAELETSVRPLIEEAQAPALPGPVHTLCGPCRQHVSFRQVRPDLVEVTERVDGLLAQQMAWSLEEARYYWLTKIANGFSRAVPAGF